MANFSHLIYGSKQAQIIILDSDDYPMGNLLTPDSPTPGTVYPSYFVPGFVKFSPPVPQYAMVSEFANERYRGSEPGPMTSINVGQLTLSRFDSFVYRVAGGSALDNTTISGWDWISANMMGNDPLKIGLILTGGIFDSLRIANLVLHKCHLNRVLPGVDQTKNQNPNNQTFDIYLDITMRTMMGLLFSDTDLDVEGDEDGMSIIPADGALMVTSYVDDGSALTFDLPIAPLSTEHASAQNAIVKEGADAHTSVSGISGATVSYTHGSSADRWTLTTPVAVSAIDVT